MTWAMGVSHTIPGFGSSLSQKNLISCCMDLLMMYLKNLE